MFSAADLLEALSAKFRRRFPLQTDRAFGEFPPTWRAWFLAIAERPGKVFGATAAELVAVVGARTLRTPPRASPVLSRWASYRVLLRQQWGPPPPDQRRARRVAAGVSGLAHVFFILLLLWVSIVRIGDAPPEAEQAGEEAVMIEFIGEGTPTEEGGAAAPGQTGDPSSASADQPSRSGAGAQAAAAAAPPPPAFVAAAPPDVDTPQPPAPAVEPPATQPLAVSETASPDPEFSVPPTSVQALTLPSLRVETPTLSTQVVEVEAVAPSVPTPTLRAPTPRPASPSVPTLRPDLIEIQTFEPTANVPTLQAPSPRAVSPTVPALRTQVTEVETHSPLPSPVPGLAPTRSNAQVRTPELRVTPGEVTMRPGTSTAASGAATPSSSSARPGSAAASGRAPSPSPTPGGRPQVQGEGRTAGVAPSGAGARPSPRPGAATSTARDDDWGASNRNVPGNSTAGSGRSTSGLFNDDGSVRLPDGTAGVGGGLPPGTILEDFEKIDRMGTWLKRPPLDYTPTRFDRFWIPNRTLLEEWVSKGIKKVAVPIPGTTKRIECTVSLLTAGGSCRVVDANLNDQEATARPPPDVPFKPELQEDKSALPQKPPATP